MFSSVLSFWIGIISSWVSWLFTLKINEDPDITIGMFLLGCAFIGVVITLILGTDFIPFGFGSSRNSSSNSDSNYVPRHAPGNGGKDYSTRVSRHK